MIGGRKRIDLRHAQLHVERLSKRFGGLRVLEDISFRVAPGEVLGVIGPNGAGKTTLINMISGRIAPTGGHVFLGDVDTTGWPTHKLSRCGVVRSFQQTNTFQGQTVRENLLRAIRFSQGSLNFLANVADLLDSLGLAMRMEERSDKLAYGLQKMLGLMMAYATNPGVLLLDEPAAGLERSERPRIDEFVAHARRHAGSAVLIVEHDMELVRRLCPRILVMDGGRVLAEGAPAEVLARTDVIEAYLGAGKEDLAA